LDKPCGMTSHDVVNVIRRITDIRRVGHAGALDPMATGVLLVCVGRATRLSEYLTSSDKRYQATARLGVETDTYDAEGDVVNTNPVQISREDVETILHRFSGSISQVPPMYSAIKQGGQPLYKLARRGIEVEREPRPVRVSHIELTQWSPPEFSFDVACSAGTYIRSLAHDLGRELGCGAHLTRLVRVQSGDFHLRDSLSLSELTSGNWQEYIQPMDRAVADFPLLTLDPSAVQDLVHGRSISRRPEHPVSDLARAYTHDNRFIALVRSSEDAAHWLPHKVFGGQ